LRGLLKKEAEKGLFGPRSNPSSGIVRQFCGLVLSWAGLRYLYVEIDWRMVGQQDSPSLRILELEVVEVSFFVFYLYSSDWTQLVQDSL